VTSLACDLIIDFDFPSVRVDLTVGTKLLLFEQRGGKALTTCCSIPSMLVKIKQKVKFKHYFLNLH